MTSDTDPAAAGRLRLFWTTRSPFARKVTMAAHELGVIDRIETTVAIVTPSHVDPALASHAPLGQIPVLLLPSGEAVYDSVVICDWLDATYGLGRLVPRDYPARLDALRREAIGDGVADRAVRWLDEVLRPEETQLAEKHAAFRSRIVHALDALERMAPEFVGKPFDIGMIAIFAALAYLDFRFGVEDWRAGRPALAAWHAAASERPSARATAFSGPVVKGPPPPNG